MQRAFSPRAVPLLLVGALLGAALMIAGCSSASEPDGSASGGDVKLLEATDWRATEIAGKATLAGADAPHVTAVFAAGKLTGSGGVNRYTAAYEIGADGAITIEQPATTLMAGPPEAMDQEHAYFSALEKAARFTVTADSLTLLDEQGAELVRYAAEQPTPLQGTTWNALAYNNGRQALVSLVADSEITAVFDDEGMLTGGASVNTYRTGYETSGDTMTIDAAIATTNKAGPEKLMRQEAEYLAALPETATYTIEGDELWLRDADGAALAHYVAAP